MIELLAASYTIGFMALGLFGLKVLLLVAGYLRTRHWIEAPSTEPSSPTAGPDVPVVTVQVPIYNERLVAARVIDAVCRLRWPRDRLEVQVLDDSTDDTRDVVDAAAEAWQALGADVQVVRRPERSGYKAGALAHGTALARGDVIAVFDADFVPQPDFLHRTVPYLGPGVAVVQARWDHLNAGRHWLTQVQALALDGHFVVEQTARARNGLLINFNGTAGIWRRAAIEAAGGWQDDTLSEDIDLSYRAQLAGWRVVYLPDVAVPAELPTTLLAFKRQQRRWAKGTTQLLRKLGRPIWRSQLPLAARVHGVLSLAEHLLHPLTLALILGMPLVIATRPALPPLLAVLWLLALAPPLLFALASAALHGDWPRHMVWYPVLAVLSLGLCVNGTVAVVEGLGGGAGAFERTPKLGPGSEPDGEPGNVRHQLWRSGYGIGPDAQVMAELAMALYCWFGVALAGHESALGWLPILVLFALGFSLTAFASLRDGLAGLPRRHRRPFRRTRGGAAAETSGHVA